jgi:hypothetical protein
VPDVDVGDRVTMATVDALREAQRPRIDIPDELRRQVTERDRLQADLDAAPRAHAVLSQELEQARTDAAAADRAARVAAATLLGRLARSSG